MWSIPAYGCSLIRPISNIFSYYYDTESCYIPASLQALENKQRLQLEVMEGPAFCFPRRRAESQRHDRRIAIVEFLSVVSHSGDNVHDDFFRNAGDMEDSVRVI